MRLVLVFKIQIMEKTITMNIDSSTGIGIALKLLAQNALLSTYEYTVYMRVGETCSNICVIHFY